MDSQILFSRLVNGTEGHPWNGNDEKGRHTHHGFIRAEDNPTTITLHWRANDAAPHRYIGTYRLNLTELLSAGYVRNDKYGNKDGFRVKFVHAENGCIYIQKDSDSPRLVVGVLE